LASASAFGLEKCFFALLFIAFDQDVAAEFNAVSFVSQSAL
jgi:hypothetical protein